jgi:hypothetical protein
MLSSVSAQINQLRREPDDAHGCLNDLIGIGDKRNDRAIMIWVYVHIEHGCALDRFDDARQPLDDFGLAAFAKVWYTLN